MSIPIDPARAIAKLLAKLDEEDKATLNFLITSTARLYNWRAAEEQLAALLDDEPLVP